MKSHQTPPSRIFLDSSTLQTLEQYGAFIWDGEEISSEDRIRAIPNGTDNLQALRNIFFINNRANFEFALSKNSLIEVAAKNDKKYLQWAYEVLDHWQTSLDLFENKPTDNSRSTMAEKLDNPSFGYLGTGDKRLIQDAILLECDGFLTMERKLPRNAVCIKRELGIHVLTPILYWKILQPWAALFA